VGQLARLLEKTVWNLYGGLHMANHIKMYTKPSTLAAHPLALDLTVVTANTREFSRVRGLRVENWLSG